MNFKISHETSFQYVCLGTKRRMMNVLNVKRVSTKPILEMLHVHLAEVGELQLKQGQLHRLFVVCIHLSSMELVD